jgi:hypothetical protein
MFNYDTDLERQARKASCITEFVLLTGDETRLEHTKALIERIRVPHRHLPSITIVGGYTGFAEEDTPQSEAYKAQLIAFGIPEYKIGTETEGRDTISGLIFAQDHLQSPHLGLITSDYHMSRAEAFAHRTGKQYITALAAPSALRMRERIKQGLIEVVGKDAVLRDTEQIPQNARARWFNYLDKMHPYHAPLAGNRPCGAYTTVTEWHDRIFHSGYRKQRDAILAAQGK